MVGFQHLVHLINESIIMIQSMRLFLLLPVFLLLSILVGCGGGSSDADAPDSLVMEAPEHERWEIALVEMRIEKNEEFSDPQRTALPVDRLKGFEGLNYYFPFPEMRFHTAFVAEAGTDTVSLTKRKGQVVPYLRRGYVKFKWQEKSYSLDVFGPVDTQGGDYLWLPFFDANSGKDVYEGGRYLDILVGEDGMVDLDFNYAYNPLCDYNPERYNCTLPPLGNTLPFAVNAGEKMFNQGH
jgi:uncharacterized protein